MAQISSFHEQQRSGGWGFIIWDEHGGVVGSGAGKIDHCHDALQAEATYSCSAALQGILFAIDAGISRLKIETDASNSNSTHTSSSFDMVVNVVMFHDIKCLLYAESVYVKVVNSTRSCNLVADASAMLVCVL